MSGIIGVSPDMRSGVVGAFPVGQSTTKLWKNTSGTYLVSGSTATVIKDSVSFPVVAGKTYKFSLLMYFSVYCHTSSSTVRYANVGIYYGSNNSQGDTSSFGTQLHSDYAIGRYVSSGSSGTAFHSLVVQNSNGIWTASSTGTEYITLVGKTGSSANAANFVHTSLAPAIYTLEEFEAVPITAFT
jgi:hypothetical protein